MTLGRLSSRHTLIARSGFENNLMMTGVTLVLNCSSERPEPILMTEDKTCGPPPPNSTDFSNSGKTLTLKNSSGRSSETSSNSLR